MLVVADYVVFSAVAALDKLNQNLKRYRHSEIYGALIGDKWTFLKLTSNHHVWPGLKYTGSTQVVQSAEYTLKLRSLSASNATHTT